MKFTVFVALAIIAVAMSHVPQANADGFLPNTKILTFSSSDGAIIGHLTGGFVAHFETIAAKSDGSFSLKVINNNSQIAVVNQTGQAVLTLSGAEANGLIPFLQSYGGMVLVSLGHIGNTENGMLTLLDINGRVIDRLAPSDIHMVGGIYTILGPKLWTLTQKNPLMFNGLLGLVNGLIDAAALILNGVINTVGNIVVGAGQIVGNVVGSVGNVVGNLLGGLVGTATNTINGLLGGVVTGVINVGGDKTNGVVNANLNVLGGPRYPPGGKIVTMRGPDGNVYLHMNSGFMIPLIERLITQTGEEIFMKVGNNKNEVVLTNKAGDVLFTNTGDVAKTAKDIIAAVGGTVSYAINFLGPIVNGVQTVVDGAGNVIDRITQDMVNDLAGEVTFVGKNAWTFLTKVPDFLIAFEGFKLNLLSQLANTGFGLVSGGINVVSNTINSILGGSTTIDKLTGSKVVTIMGSDNKIAGHIYGNQVLAFEMLAKQLSGIITLAPADSLIAIIDSTGKTVGTIEGSNVPDIKELINKLGGRIMLTINTAVIGKDNNGQKVLTILNSTGAPIDALPANALHAISVAVGKVTDKALVLGTGLNGLDNNVSTLISAIAQLVSKSTDSSSSNGEIQAGSPVIAVGDKDGHPLTLLLGGKFVLAMQEIFKQYGGNLFLTLNNGVVNISNEAGKIMEQIAGNDQLNQLMQELGGKIVLTLNKVDVTTDKDGKQVVVAVDNNKNIIAAITGNPMSLVDSKAYGDKTIVVGNAPIGVILVGGLSGDSTGTASIGSNGSTSTTGSTGGQIGGSGSVSSGGSSGGLLGGLLSGTDGGLLSSILGGSGGNLIGSLTGGLLGGSSGIFGSVLGSGGLLGGLIGGSNGGLLGGVTGGLLSGLVGGASGLTGGLLGGSNGGLLGGLTGGGSNGGILGGLTGSLLGGSNGGLLGGLTGGSGTGLLGGLTGGSDGGILGGITGTLTGGSGLLGGLTGGSGGGVVGSLTGGSSGGLLGGITGILTGGLNGGSGGLTGGSGGGLLGGITGTITGSSSGGGLLGGLTGGSVGGLLGGLTGGSGGGLLGGLTGTVTGGAGGGGLLGGLTGGLLGR